VNAGKNADAGLTFLRQLPSMDVKGVSPSTSCSLDMNGVSISTSSSMDVQGVSLYNLVTEEVKIIDDDLNPFSPHSTIFLRLSTVQFGEGGSQNLKDDLNPF
jgi:hypothetical protein